MRQREERWKKALTYQSPPYQSQPSLGPPYQSSPYLSPPSLSPPYQSSPNQWQPYQIQSNQSRSLHDSIRKPGTWRIGTISENTWNAFGLFPDFHNFRYFLFGTDPFCSDLVSSSGMNVLTYKSHHWNPNSEFVRPPGFKTYIGIHLERICPFNIF